MCFHLDAAAQRLFEHWSKVFRFLPEKTGGFGRVAVRLQQSCAARAKGAVEKHFDRALGKMVIERVDDGSFAQEILRVLAGTVDGVDESTFDFASSECFLDNIDVFPVAAGVLKFAPAEFDLALDSAQQRLFPLRLSSFWNAFSDKVLRVIEQHSVWLSVFF